MSDLRMRIADEISGIAVGSGCESTTIGIDAALEAADALIAAGVVTEEPEWEYGFNWVDHAYQEPHPIALGRGEQASEWAERIKAEIGDVVLYRRTAPSKAGPWVPVKQEGAEDV